MLFCDVLHGLRPRIPESLLAGQGWDRLLDRVGGLPAAAASACGFELRLGEPEPAADLSVIVAPGPVARHHISKGEAAPPASTESWLGTVLAGASGPDDWIDWVMLVGYDVAEHPGRHASPAIYLSPLLSRRAGGPALAPELIAATVGRAAGGGNARIRRALVRACNALPSGAEVAFVAVAPNRTPKSVKLIVAGVTAPQLAPLLDRTGWEGSIGCVHQLLSGMRDVSAPDRFMLSLDLTEAGALPRLGFEMYPAHLNGADNRALLATWLSSTNSDWSGFLARLVDMGLCLPEKSSGLSSWTKRHNIYGTGGVYRLHMGINHIKIAVAGERLQAKAYAGMRFIPIDPPAGAYS